MHFYNQLCRANIRKTKKIEIIIQKINSGRSGLMEEFLFAKELETHTTGKSVFQLVVAFSRLLSMRSKKRRLSFFYRSKIHIVE